MDLFIPLMLAFAVAMLFISFRNQKKRTKAMNDVRAQAVPGARVQLTCGLHGTIFSDDGGENVDVEIAPGVVTTWNRLAIREVVADDAPAAAEAPAIETVTDDVPTNDTGIDDKLIGDAPEARPDTDSKDK
ncbi:MAG: preprotein translocase subunit YajC [Gordonia sp. (in: high G+C Gram-positive bacteria)]|uniref:preprotein translocase subunit YajC n=1 Tax=Gordonia sp. (in: high G+C Gram-positive bacteria) TaxID=84139 RepID=UPI003BB4F65F